jgi:hypothetical protein
MLGGRLKKIVLCFISEEELGWGPGVVMLMTV